MYKYIICVKTDKFNIPIKNISHKKGNCEFLKRIKQALNNKIGWVALMQKNQ